MLGFIGNHRIFRLFASTSLKMPKTSSPGPDPSYPWRGFWNQQDEQLRTKNWEIRPTIQKYESVNERVDNELEGEVNNVTKWATLGMFQKLLLTLNNYGEVLEEL